MNPDTERLNPDIKEAKIGVRRLRKIKIYPLSAKDQFELTDLVTGSLQGFLSLGQKGLSDVDFVREIVGLIRNNIDKILKLTTDEKEVGEDVLSNMTNNQAIEIAEIIYSVNFATLQKKVADLLKQLPSLTRRSSLDFFGDTRNTTLSTSTEEPIEMEDSLSDKPLSSTSTQNGSDGTI